MKPWERIGSAPVPFGKEITLDRRGDEFSVRVDGAILMTSRVHNSERELGTRGVAHCAGRPNVRVLVGGLGMGFTLRAVLDAVGDDARVDVVELVAEVVAWNRGPLAPLAGSPLLDPRVTVVIADAAEVIDKADRLYDAIILDVDNGPVAMTSPRNARLYDEAGLRRASRALSPRGVLTVWSSDDNGGFTANLRDAGFHARAERVRARVGGGGCHVIWRATRP